MADLHESQPTMSAKPALKWNFDKESILIECVRNQRHLWDIKHELYPNRNLKRISYQNIAAVLSEKYPESSELFTVDEVMNKFANLRTYFRRQLKLYNNQPSGSAGIGFVPKHKHFFNLQFLGDTFEACESDSNMNKINEEVADETEAADESIIIDSFNESPPPCPRIKLKNGRKRKNSNEIREFAYETLKELKEKEDDEEEVYGQYIAKVLKSFDPLTRDLCKVEFQNVIFKLRHNQIVNE